MNARSAHLRRYDDVDRLADRIRNQAGTDPQTLFQIACGYAICAHGKAPKAEEYRNKALAVIQRLLKAGWKDPVGLQSDLDFEYLRNDPAFRQLIKEVPK